MTVKKSNKHGLYTAGLKSLRMRKAFADWP